MDEVKKQAIDLMVDGMHDLASTARLQFSFSTGAVVLFAHAISEFRRMPVRTGILTVAALFFGFSAIKCIRALIHLSSFKVGMGDTIWRDEERKGDLLLEKSKAHIDGMKSEFGKMDRYFYAGVAWSVLFMIVQFAASFK